MSKMDHAEAFEFAVLRIEEENVSWAVAYDEYRSHIDCHSIAATMLVGRRLQHLAAARDARRPGSSK